MLSTCTSSSLNSLKVQRRVKNPVKHLKWSVLPLTICIKRYILEVCQRSEYASEVTKVLAFSHTGCGHTTSVDFPRAFDILLSKLKSHDHKPMCK